jgi:paraquat-inducible protein B
MSEKPHTVAIGAFVVGALLIAVTTILVLLGPGFDEDDRIIMVFDGSVKGLNVGAPLALRGVNVGKVSKIELLLDSNNVELIMLVEADFDGSNIREEGAREDEDITPELIARGLRAQLNTLSLLTGLLYIELDFYPNSELVLADIDSPYFQFPTIPTDLQRITRKLQDIDPSKLITELGKVSEGMDTLINSEDFQALPGNMTTTLNSLTELTTQLKDQLASTGPKLDTALDEAATTINTANTELPKLSQLVASNLNALNDSIAVFEKTMTDVNGLVAYDSATVYRFNTALQELTRAGKALQSLANTLEEQPESLIQGKSGDK